MYLGVRHKISAWLRTIFVFTVLLLILLYVRFRTPIPPYPEGGGGPGMGIEVNIGDYDEGSGDNLQLMPLDVPDFKSENKPKIENEEVLTQDVEEAPVIKTNDNSNQPKNNNQQTDKQKETEDQQKNQENQKRQAIDNLAKNAFNNNQNAGPQGQKNGNGNQGNPQGSPDANNFGVPGNGNGTGDGTGDGNGPGISASLFGRNPLYLAIPEKKIQKEGIIVVEVTVDKEGKVTQAIPGVKGTTSLDENLLKAAKQAALNTRFDTKLDAPAFQKGTITYIFKLK